MNINDMNEKAASSYSRISKATQIDPIIISIIIETLLALFANCTMKKSRDIQDTIKNRPLISKAYIRSYNKGRDAKEKQLIQETLLDMGKNSTVIEIEGALTLAKG